MKSLIIDTSHEISYIILAKDSEIIFFKKIEKINLSRELFQNIDDILKKTNTDISNLKYIATSIGPGSFTGLRVGATICQTISYAKNRPLIGYISLKAYAPSCEGKFLSVFDAKSEGVFLLEGLLKHNEITYLSEPKLLSIDEAKKKFDIFPTIISPDTINLLEKFKDYKNKLNICFFDPLRLVSLTENLYQNKKFTHFNSLNLLYLRGPNHIE